MYQFACYASSICLHYSIASYRPCVCIILQFYNNERECVLCMYTVGLSDTTVLAIYRNILKVSISRFFVINYRDTMPVHNCH